LVGCLVEDVNRTALIDKHLLYRVVLEIYSDEHRVILLMGDAVEVIVSKGNGRHVASVVRLGYVIDGLEGAKVFLSG